MVDSQDFLEWVKAVRNETRARYDATIEQMYGHDAKKLGQSIRQFYRDWWDLLSARGKADIGNVVAEIITDIEQKLETGIGTIDRGERQA